MLSTLQFTSASGEIIVHWLSSPDWASSEESQGEVQGWHQGHDEYIFSSDFHNNHEINRAEVKKLRPREGMHSSQPQWSARKPELKPRPYNFNSGFISS